MEKNLKYTGLTGNRNLTFASTERNSSKQRSGFDSRSSLYCFRFFFNRLGCSNCQDYVLFHLFIRSSIYDFYIPSHNEVNLLDLLLTVIQNSKTKINCFSPAVTYTGWTNALNSPVKFCWFLLPINWNVK